MLENKKYLFLIFKAMFIPVTGMGISPSSPQYGAVNVGELQDISFDELNKHALALGNNRDDSIFVLARIKDEHMRFGFINLSKRLEERLDKFKGEIEKMVNELIEKKVNEIIEGKLNEIKNYIYNQSLQLKKEEHVEKLIGDIINEKLNDIMELKIDEIKTYINNKLLLSKRK